MADAHEPAVKHPGDLLLSQKSDDEGEGEGSEASEDFVPGEDEDEEGSEEPSSDDESLVDRWVRSFIIHVTVCIIQCMLLCL